MKRLIIATTGVALTASMAALGSTSVSATPSGGGVPVTTAAEGASEPDLPHPLEDKRTALREQAVAAVVGGDLQPQTVAGSEVVQVGEGAAPQDAALAQNDAAPQAKRQAAQAKPQQAQYVELAQERADKVFVILAEFGDERHPDYPDGDTDPNTPGPERFDGPRHNTIAEPDRSLDNTTVWQADYDRAHYESLYFGTGEGVESVKTYYEKQSSGRYTVDGTVSDWVKVPYNTARYGREDADTWQLVADALEAWVADQKVQGKTDAQIAATIAEYDVYDRYDFDGDGVFDEPDGYIDHFQIVHAGPGEEDGDSSYGEDAIWSHRWYAFLTDAGLTGPSDNKLGGTQVGSTGVWVGDYTIQPENGGLSVFVHEYGHDLGLPDAYDTSGGGDNNNEHWTLMAQSRLNAEGEPLGTRPGDFGAWEKLQLGWLDYEVVAHDDTRSLDLGPQEYNSNRPQAAVVPLPDKEVTTDNGAPFAGEKQFFSGSGDDLAHSLTTTVDLTDAATASLTGQVRYEIEEGYDYLYVQASTDGGATWTSLDGTIDGQPIGTDTSGRPGIDGEQVDWAALEVPLDAYAGAPVQLRFHYKTDGGLALAGFFADDLVVSADGEELSSDGAEQEGGAWTGDGFSAVGASTTATFDHFYIMGNRSYVDYDKYLQTGPYNFGFADTKPDWVEHYPYQEGLLISYWDTSQADNNTSQHPGEGRSLIIDSRPRPDINLWTGLPWRARIQVYDAPFSKKKADTLTLHTNGKESKIRGEAAVPTFSDTGTYFYDSLPNHGVKLPATGFSVTVTKQNGTNMTVKFNKK